MSQGLVHYSKILKIVVDILKVRVPPPASGTDAAVKFGDLAMLEASSGGRTLAQVININRDAVSLQVFGGTKGISTDSTVTFLGHAMRVTYSSNILGRVFDGIGRAVDHGPDLSMDPTVDIGGPSVNPSERVVPTKMIRTDVPMIDVFNCLVESQKIPIFSVLGEPFNSLLARIGIQADADIVIFGGLGLVFDDYYMFGRAFEDAGVFSRTVMFVNQASDPIVERLPMPDMALAVAEKSAVEKGERVLVLLSDMTAYADALKEVGISMVRLYSGGQEAQQKQAMAFELSEYDEPLLKFSDLFRERFMDIEVSIPLEDALDLCWRTLAECFRSEQLLMRQELVDKYFPHNVGARVSGQDTQTSAERGPGGEATAYR